MAKKDRQNINPQGFYTPEEVDRINGAQTDDDLFEAFKSTLPDNQRNDDGSFNTRKYWELNNRPADFNAARDMGMYTMDNDGLYHAKSVAYDKDADEYVFMKGQDHPTYSMEVDWYNSDDPEAVAFRKEWALDESGDESKYVRRPAASEAGTSSNALSETQQQSVITPDKYVQAATMGAQQAGAEQGSTEGAANQQTGDQPGQDVITPDKYSQAAMKAAQEQQSTSSNTSSETQNPLAAVEADENSGRAEAEEAKAMAGTEAQQVQDVKQMASQQNRDWYNSPAAESFRSIMAMVENPDGTVSFVPHAMAGAQQETPEKKEEPAKEESTYDSYINDITGMMNELQGQIETEQETGEQETRQSRNAVLFGALTNAAAAIANLAQTRKGANSAKWTSPVPQWQNRMDTIRTQREAKLKDLRSQLTSLQSQRRQLMTAKTNAEKIQAQQAIKEQELQTKLEAAALKKAESESKSNAQLARLDETRRNNIMRSTITLLNYWIKDREAMGRTVTDKQISDQLDIFWEYCAGKAVEQNNLDLGFDGI